MENSDSKANRLSKSKLITSVAVISLGFFMTTLDSSVVNVALPVVQDYFHETQAMAEWAITIYLLVISGTVLCFGKLSDLKGRKKLIAIGFSIFTFSSIVCGVSASFIMLIVFRAIQALGGAMVMSAGPAIITDIVPQSSRGKAFSTTAISISLALCAGPVIGGLCISTFGWQSVFFLNIPFGVVAIILVLWALPSDQVQEKVPFDVFGSVLFFVSLVLITWSLNIMNSPGKKIVSLLTLILGILLISGFVIWENHIRYPLLKMSLFRNRTFIAGNASLFMAFIMQYGFIYITPYFFEKHWMMSASAAGEAMLPITVAMICVAPFSGILADHFKNSKICAFGMLLTAVGIFVLCYGLIIKKSMVYWIICSIMAGIGCGLFQTPNMKQIMESVDTENRGVASGTRSIVINVGDVIGVSVAGTIYSTVFNISNWYTQGTSAAFTASTYAYSAVFLSLGFITVLAAVLSYHGGKVRTDTTRMSNHA